MTRKDFVIQNYPMVARLIKGTGIYPQTIFAQAIIESSGKMGNAMVVGKSALALNANNYFGIKAFNWTGRKYNNGKDWFRAYDNMEESFADYVKLITSKPQYKKALQADSWVKQIDLMLTPRNDGTDYEPHNPDYKNMVTKVAAQVDGYLANVPEAQASTPAHDSNRKMWQLLGWIVILLGVSLIMANAILK